LGPQSLWGQVWLEINRSKS